jgi:hypothetical protein
MVAGTDTEIQRRDRDCMAQHLRVHSIAASSLKTYARGFNYWLLWSVGASLGSSIYLQPFKFNTYPTS